MDVVKFVEILGADFYTGVPDSQLKALCDYIYGVYGIDRTHHIIAANEGNAVGIAAGYYLATGKVPVVYLQNSGEGNIINPVASLLNEKVYGIPMIFIIGWRGEPGVHDEPQHLFQGEITIRLLEDLDIEHCVVGRDTTEDELRKKRNAFNEALLSGKQAAFVMQKDALEFNGSVSYHNDFSMRREETLKVIVKYAKGDLIVSTTGKTSRELFEVREGSGQGHNCDFLTVGSMGHSSSIALGLALQRTERRIWCIDGDGAMLMHMGAMATIGSAGPNNLVHIVINNEAHESVGGMPTVAEKLNLLAIADACGYERCLKVREYNELESALAGTKEDRKLTFIEVCCGIGSRPDLGRPKIKPHGNMIEFMRDLQ